jgi:hypothetical protein
MAVSRRLGHAGSYDRNGSRCGSLLPEFIAGKRPLVFRCLKAASRQRAFPTPCRHSRRRGGNDRSQSPTAIRSRGVACRLSAIAVTRLSALVRRLWVAFLSFASRRTRMTGLTASGCVLATPMFRWKLCARATRLTAVPRIR